MDRFLKSKGTRAREGCKTIQIESEREREGEKSASFGECSLLRSIRQAHGVSKGRVAKSKGGERAAECQRVPKQRYGGLPRDTAAIGHDAAGYRTFRK